LSTKIISYTLPKTKNTLEYGFDGIGIVLLLSNIAQCNVLV